MKKPLSPLAHGLIDYGIVAALFIVPPIVGLNKKAINLYRILAAGLGVYVAISDTGASVEPVIAFEKHYEIDHFNLETAAGLAFHKDIRKERKAVLFSSAISALAFYTVLLTIGHHRNGRRYCRRSNSSRAWS